MVTLAGRRRGLIGWLARIREAGHPLEMMPDILCLRRIRDGSLSQRSRPELARGYMQTVREALLRKRARQAEGED